MQTTIRPRRSVLYMPGSNSRAHDKARALPVDAIIVDLEDSIAPEHKEAARETACAAIRAGGFGHREVTLRINSLDTVWGPEDLAQAVDAGPDAIVLTKVESPDDLARVGTAVRARRTGPVAVWAMIETPMALLNIREIAAYADADAPLAAFVLGTNDIAKEMRLPDDGGRAAMTTFLSMCVVAARAHGLDILDGVYNDFSDDAGFREECAEGRRLGMDGKTLIHPRQVEAANEAFAPSRAEVEAARAVIAAFDLPENRGKGAINLDGRMVEILHAEVARRTVALADAIAERQT